MEAIQYWQTVGMQEMDAYDKYRDEFAEWLMESDRVICNGDMLISYMEDGNSFDEFMEEMHPKEAI